MGATGKSKLGSSGLTVSEPIEEKEPKYTVFNSTEGADKWFHNDKLSNANEWESGLTSDETGDIRYYTGNGYKQINGSLYNGKGTKSVRVKTITAALDKFEINKGITVTRRCDFQIFGSNSAMSIDQVKAYFAATGDTKINPAFMSFSADSAGRAIAGSGLKISLHIPPSKGAGAYIRPLSHIKRENEFLLNRNAVIKFDPSSIKMVDGNIYIEADWLGQSK